MRTDLFFDFTVDKAAKTVTITREFDAELPGSEWDYKFNEQDGKTIVRIVIYNVSLERMVKLIVMGFTEGFKMSISNLDDLLETISKK